MKAQWDDGGGRILLGDKTVGRAVILRQRSGSSVLKFGFQVDSSVCILVLIDRVYTVYIYDICNCNWVATRWQLFSTHIHTNNKGTSQNKQYIEQHNN
jgi:hypothetical protein